MPSAHMLNYKGKSLLGLVCEATTYGVVSLGRNSGSEAGLTAHLPQISVVAMGGASCESSAEGAEFFVIRG